VVDLVSRCSALNTQPTGPLHDGNSLVGGQAPASFVVPATSHEGDLDVDGLLHVEELDAPVSLHAPGVPNRLGRLPAELGAEQVSATLDQDSAVGARP
jgi:hypothetical protein